MKMAMQANTNPESDHIITVYLEGFTGLVVVTTVELFTANHKV